ncbi:hypothetical protein Tco_1071805, partial [Tanacetum coccineum]
MVEMQKPSKDKCGLGYTETIASPRNTKIKNLGDHLKKLSVEPAGRCHSSTAPTCSIEQHRVSDDSTEKEKDLETNIPDFLVAIVDLKDTTTDISLGSLGPKGENLLDTLGVYIKKSSKLIKSNPKILLNALDFLMALWQGASRFIN